MNNIENMLKKSLDVREFSRLYIDYLSDILKRIDPDAIACFVQSLEKARQNNKNIFFVGNGGSASTASHMVNDFGVGFQKVLPHEHPFRAISLNENNAVMLAVANDEGYDNLFVNQLRVLYQPGDYLVAISASGNSPNIVKAAEWVNEQEGTVLALVGFEGGKLLDLADFSIHIPSIKGEYGPVEDAHMIMDHMMICWLKYSISQYKNNSDIEDSFMESVEGV